MNRIEADPATDDPALAMARGELAPLLQAARANVEASGGTTTRDEATLALAWWTVRKDVMRRMAKNDGMTIAEMIAEVEGRLKSEKINPLRVVDHRPGVDPPWVAVRLNHSVQITVRQRWWNRRFYFQVYRTLAESRLCVSLLDALDEMSRLANLHDEGQ